MGSERRLGVLASGRGFGGEGLEGEVSLARGSKDARLKYGVSPVDEDAVEVSGPGSENRTRFLGLVGVFGVCRGPSVCCTPDVVTGSARPVLMRRFRRTARGLSSVMSGSS